MIILLNKQRLRFLYDLLNKIPIAMRLTFVLLFMLVFQLQAEQVYSQQVNISLNLKNTSIEKILREIEEKSAYYFLYNNKLINVDRKADINVKDESIANVLNQLFNADKVEYEVKGSQIILHPLGMNQIVSESAALQQQKKQITGNVTDKQGEPIIGANIVETNTANGTITDIDGNFTLNVNNNASIQVLYIGYLTQEIKTAGRTRFDIVLQEDALTLDEVVVVGYGTQKKVNLTGAVSSVGGNELSKRMVGQTSMALQGALPGVTITQRSGQSGADGGGIRIRGIGTIGDANPLVLIDGVEGSMENIDPTTIESISVLKDAASSSIYGSRAANGVVLVTTKRMKEKGFTINYSGYLGFQSPTDLRDMVNAQDHMSLMNIAYENTGKSPVFDPEMVRNYASLHASDPDNYPDVDWQELVYTEKGLTQNHSVAINVGSDRVKFMASLGYYDQKGLIKNTDFKRYTLRINSDVELNSRLSLKLDMLLRQMERDEPGSGVSSVIEWMNRMPATQPAVYTNGKYGYGWQGNNPLAMAKDGGYREYVNPSVILNLGFNFKITDNLKLDFAYAPHFWEQHYKGYQTELPTYYPDESLAYSVPDATSLTHKNNRYKKNNIKATLHYDNKFGDHGVGLLAGWQDEDYWERWFSGSRRGFDLPGYDVLDAGAKDEQKAEGTGSEWALRSFFGRINYNYKERYLFEANIRYDGSSRFAKGHRWGLFPSFSGGWRISEEAFWEPLRSTFDNFKIRASWGQLGNQNIGTYPFDSFVNLALPYVFNSSPYNGAALQAMANNRISWEKTEMTNFGVDFTLFKNLQVTFDYYIKNTSDILLTLDVPKIIGLTAPYQNAGKVRNKGWELALNYGDKVNDFSYNIGFNLSDVKNKVIDLKGINSADLVVNHEGYSMNSIYALEAIGFFTSEDQLNNHAKQYGNYSLGDIMYKDQLTIDTDGDGIPDEADGVINDDDKVIVGNSIPRFTFGLSTYLSWKNFDFNMLLQGVGKADGYLYSQAVMPFYLGGTATEGHKDYWSEDNPNATYPRLAFNEPNNEKHSTFWMKNAAYLRVKNVQIGYNIPKKILQNCGIQSTRIYVSGQNLFSFDSFWDGFDVESAVGRGNHYPQVRSFSVGLDVKF